ncbi:ATP-dependent Clp protease proteolytic subunit [Candidatus Azambacteria bacterium]|nr:ATP-dependent Clp protease proteolytic subunit [Candidatus Azambacteria bacterium]
MEGRTHDVLLKKRIIYLGERVSEKEALRIGDAIIALNAESNAPIMLYINSNGGNIDAGLSIYDMLRHSVAPITGIVQQKAYSAASIILQGCHARKALKHAQILIHNGFVGMDKKFDDMGDIEKEIRAIIEDSAKKRAFMYAIYAEKTGMSVEEIKRICLVDKAIYADEAKTLGLIDEVI